MSLSRMVMNFRPRSNTALGLPWVRRTVESSKPGKETYRRTDGRPRLRLESLTALVIERNTPSAPRLAGYA